MNTQGFLDSFKKTVNRHVGEGERRQPTGVVSLLFSGTVFSLLGGSYLLKQVCALSNISDLDCCHQLSTLPLRTLCAKWTPWTRERKFPFKCMERYG